MEEDDVEFLRAQAKKCRSLARMVSSPDVAQTLSQMAEDYDARATRLGNMIAPPEGKAS